GRACSRAAAAPARPMDRARSARSRAGGAADRTASPPGARWPRAPPERRVRQDHHHDRRRRRREPHPHAPADVLLPALQRAVRERARLHRAAASRGVLGEPRLGHVGLEAGGHARIGHGALLAVPAAEGSLAVASPAAGTTVDPAAGRAPVGGTTISPAGGGTTATGWTSRSDRMYSRIAAVSAGVSAP